MRAPAATLDGHSIAPLQEDALTLDEMAAEFLEHWSANDPEMVALWDRNRLWDRAERLASRVRAEARDRGMSEGLMLMEYQTLFRQPGVPGDGELA